jgi:hypothetical protein
MNKEFGSKKTQSVRLVKVGGIGIALLLLLALVTTSFADGVVGSLEVTGGSLTISAVDNPAFPGVTLNGTSQSVSDAIDIDVKDLRGTGGGWTLDVTSTTFTNGASKTLPTTALAITGVTVACDDVCTNPTNGTSYNVAVPADTVAPSAITFFDAAADSGLGDFTITPTFELTIPSTAYAGSYTSNVTLTVAALP